MIKVEVEVGDVLRITKKDLITPLFNANMTIEEFCPNAEVTVNRINYRGGIDVAWSDTKGYTHYGMVYQGEFELVRKYGTVSER